MQSSSGIRRRRRPAVAFVLLAGAVLAAPILAAAPAAADAANTFQFKELSQGANVVLSPNCPFGDWVPTVDTVCDTYTVWYVRFARAVDGGPIANSSALFHAEIDHETDLVHPDGSGEELAYEFGVAPVAGSYDATHLSQAHMDAVAVPLRDVALDTGASTPNGRTVHLGPFAWTAASGTYEYGNDGPALGTGPRHMATRCETTNNLAHQKDTVGYVTGSLDGASIASDYQLVQIPGLQPADATGYIFNNWFHIDDVTRC